MVGRHAAATAAALAAVLLGGPLSAAEPAPAESAGFRFGGAVALGAPAGELADHVDVAGGLSGFALFGRPRSPLALRLDAGWLLHGTETLRRTVPGTQGRVREDVATTDNWIAHAAVGPQLMATSGRVRPYVNAFAGVSHFATTSELVRPRRFVATQDPFRTTTHFDDTAAAYGAGAGLVLPLGSGGSGLDLGVRYVANGRVRFLAEGDGVDDPQPRRSRGQLVEVRIGLVGLR